MLKSALVATGALVAVAFAAAATGQAAMAATPNCLNKVNRYVACTDKLKAKTANPTRTIRTRPLWSAGARNRF